ncbi:MAG: hypothetical protein ACFE0P_07310 [Oceanicaulis sp.]
MAGTRPRVLLTAFGPFPGAPVNPTPAIIARAARLLEAQADIETQVLETCFASVPDALAHAARRTPEVVMMTGLAAGAQRMRLEHRARNETLPGRADASGAGHQGGPIDPGAPAELSARADLTALAAALTGAGLECELSRDAGRYVCEFAYFHALRLFAEARVVFVHLPITDTAARTAGSETHAGPVLPEADAARAVATVVAALAVERDGPAGLTR